MGDKLYRDNASSEVFPQPHIVLSPVRLIQFYARGLSTCICMNVHVWGTLYGGNT